MNEMTLPSKRLIRNPSPGGLRPSTETTTKPCLIFFIRLRLLSNSSPECCLRFSSIKLSISEHSQEARSVRDTVLYKRASGELAARVLGFICDVGYI